ncbi:MAG: DegV family protein, partial [Longimicrobiales bacterium]
DNPVEGTILTVIRDSASAARGVAVTDFAALMRVVQARASESLARTPDLLPALSRANVVDAGAKGFVSLIDGIIRLIESGVSPEEPAPTQEPFDGAPSPVALAEFPHERGSYRFCTEGLVEGPDLPSEDDVRRALREGAEELIVIRTEGVLKVHLHTDHPDAAFDYLKTLGSLVTHKAEDMWAQHEAVQRMEEAGSTGSAAVRRAVGVLVDSASDLPEAIVKAHGVEVVPLTLVEGDVSYQDRFELTAEAFHERLASGGPLPTTSQPTPGSFVEAYRRAATESESLVAVLVGSKLSGTVSTAGAAAQMVPEVKVHVVDSGGASLLTGLLALKAAELAEAGMMAEEIVSELKRIRGQSNILFTVRELDRLIASGRVTRFNGWLGGFLDLKPVLGMDWDGGVKAYGKARGAAKVQKLLLDKIEREIPADATRLRFGVTHVGAPELLPSLVAAVKARFGDHEVITAPATPVISTHLGTGAYGIAYICE